MEFLTKSKKQNGFWVTNPTPEIEKVLIENGWEESQQDFPIPMPREFTLKGSGLFRMWTKEEYKKVQKYLDTSKVRRITLQDLN